MAFIIVCVDEMPVHKHMGCSLHRHWRAVISCISLACVCHVSSKSSSAVNGVHCGWKFMLSVLLVLFPKAFFPLLMQVPVLWLKGGDWYRVITVFSYMLFAAQIPQAAFTPDWGNLKGICEFFPFMDKSRGFWILARKWHKRDKLNSSSLFAIFALWTTAPALCVYLMGGGENPKTTCAILLWSVNPGNACHIKAWKNVWWLDTHVRNCTSVGKRDTHLFCRQGLMWNVLDTNLSRFCCTEMHA